MRIPYWVFDAYPWAADVLVVLNFIREEWHKIEGLVILIGMILVARRLRQERVKLSDRVDTLRQIVQAAREETEVAQLQAQIAVPPLTSSPNAAGVGNQATAQSQTQVEVSDGVPNWEAIRSAWSEIRERIELKIERIRRARVRSKYSEFTRYTYMDIINALRHDDEIKVPVWLALINMDRLFHQLKFRPQSVSAVDVANFQACPPWQTV